MAIHREPLTTSERPDSSYLLLRKIGLKAIIVEVILVSNSSLGDGSPMVTVELYNGATTEYS